MALVLVCGLTCCGCRHGSPVESIKRERQGKARKGSKNITTWGGPRAGGGGVVAEPGACGLGSTRGGEKGS